MRMVTMVMGFPPLLIQLLTPAANALVRSNEYPIHDLEFMIYPMTEFLNPARG
jgi:hypothetical protein